MLIKQGLEREGIPPKYYGASAKDCKLTKEQFNQIDVWCETCAGTILLSGDPGRGKTYTAIAFMYYFEKAKKIPWHSQKFISMPDFYQEWLSGFSSSQDNYENLGKLKEKKVLIFDDIGLRKPTDGFLEYLHALINHRCNEPDLITIFTTNLVAKEFNDLMGPRLTSRITAGLNLKLDGEDMRKEQNKVVPIIQNQKFGTLQARH